MWNPRHLDFDRDRDIALDLLGGLARALGHDIDERRHRIGIGLDVEPEKAYDARAEEKEQQDHHQDTLSQRKGDDGVHRRSRVSGYSPCAARSMKRLPLVTTLSPASRPASTSTFPSLVLPTRIGRSSSVLSSWATQTRAASPS